MATAQLETSNALFLPDTAPAQMTATKNLSKSQFTTENVYKNTKTTVDATKVTTSEDVIQPVTSTDATDPVTTISGAFRSPSADDITIPIITDDSNPIFTGDILLLDNSNNVLSALNTISKVTINKQWCTTVIS